MKISVVITACSGRERNLARVYERLAQLDPKPHSLVTVFDGCAPFKDLPHPGVDWNAVEIDKHRPGMEQPRNVGARKVRYLWPDVTHVWFVDSDLVFEPSILGRLVAAYDEDPLTYLTGPEQATTTEPATTQRVLIGPYDLLQAGLEQPDHSLRNDIRWGSFNEHGPNVALVNNVGAGLGCFGGNLVWPIDEFERVGGFHPDLHHGRCEDGELGLRAASAGVPMTLVGGARAWHVWHPRSEDWIHKANERDVPMLNAMHPWVQEQGIVLTEADGARFDFACTEPDCDIVMNSHDSWKHLSQHRLGQPFTFNDPASVRHV